MTQGVPESFGKELNLKGIESLEALKFELDEYFNNDSVIELITDEKIDAEVSFSRIFKETVESIRSVEYNTSGLPIRYSFQAGTNPEQVGRVSITWDSTWRVTRITVSYPRNTRIAEAEITWGAGKVDRIERKVYA